MLFNSYSFLLFFPVVTFVFFLIPKKSRYIWLLFASYYFYMSWSVKYAMLIALVTGTTYCGALILDSQSFDGQKGKYCKCRKPLFVFFTALTLSSLFFFKYSSFVVENIEKLSSYIYIYIRQRNKLCALQHCNPTWYIVLHIAISWIHDRCLSRQTSCREKLSPLCALCLILPAAYFRTYTTRGHSSSAA